MQTVEQESQRKKRMPRAFRLTERDQDILTFINEFGFCEMPQLDKRFSLNKPRNYEIMRRLVNNGLLIHERILHNHHGVYRLSPEGARCTNLPSLARVPLATYRHDLLVVEVHLRLRLEHPDARWISARHLMQEKHQHGVGKTGHLPDGILVFENGEQIAIEVELTPKGKNRLERILRGYGGAFEYKEVRYYCSKETEARTAHMVTKMSSIKEKSFINVHSLEKLLKN